MKFAKVLIRAISASVIAPEQWLDYRSLKKLLKSLPPLPLGSDVEARLSACPRASSFFVALLWELRKVSAYFVAAEGALLAAYDQCVAEFLSFCVAFAPGSRAALLAAGRSPEDARALRLVRHRPLLATLAFLASSLLHLENYAVLCYAGCGKILKKHDKVRGVPTRAAFMQAHVNPLPFSAFPRLRRMLAGVERIYGALTAMFGEDGADLTVNDAAELCFLEELRGMARSAAVCLEEGGFGAPDEAAAAAAAAVAAATEAAAAAAAAAGGAQGAALAKDAPPRRLI
jgi:SPX domain protein involved in polyphosphate accumulation